MTIVENIIAQVSTLPGPQTDEILGAALPTADTTSQQYIVKQLLRRNLPSSRTMLIRHYHWLCQALQQTLHAHVKSLAGELLLLLSDPHPQTARNGLALIHATGLLDLAYLIPESLRSSHRDLQEQAAQTLLAFAQRTKAPSPDLNAPIPAATLDTLHQSLLAALHSYHGHRQQGVLQTLAILGPSAIHKAAEVLSDSRHVAVVELRQLLTTAQEPWVRQALPLFLLVPTLTKSALAGFRRSRLLDQHVDVFTHPHLLQLPRMRAILGHLRDCHQWLIPPADYARMTGSQQHDYALWLERLPLPPHIRIEALGSMKHITEPRARLAAVRVLIALAQGPSRDASQQTLAEYHQDPSPPIAQLALLHLLRTRWPGLLRLLPALVNSPHASIRAWATRQLAPMAFERLWTAWPKLNETQKLAAGAAHLKFDPAFHKRLRDRLAAKERSMRLRTLAMIATLGQGSSFERLLLHLLDDPDPKVVAMVVRGLGSTSLPPASLSPHVKIALHHSLRHADARVRANAVEALDQLGVLDHEPRLLEMAQKDAGRPRANAIKALLRIRHPQADAAIHRMLTDPHPNQRRSALWVVQSMNWQPEARRVAEMSLTDPDPIVRKQADKIIQQLLDDDQTDTPREVSPVPSAATRLASCILTPLAFLWMTGLPLMAITPCLAAEPSEPTDAWLPNPRWSRVALELPKYLQQDYISLPLNALWILLLSMGLILGVLRWIQHRRNPQDHPWPLMTFWSLAGVLGLTWRDRVLLIRVAHREKLPSPLTLLLSPATLEYHGRAFAGHCLGRRRVEQHLTQLRRRLFET